MIIATHDRDLIAHSGRRVISLDHGKIIDEKIAVAERPARKEGIFGLGA